MSEEEVAEKEVEEVVEAVDTDPIEALASKMGYNPDWEGDDKDRVSAEDYILRGDKINRQASKDIRELKTQLSGYDSRMQEIAVNSSRQMKAALDSQRARLTEERSNAVEVGDTEAFNKVQTAIDNLEPAETFTPNPEKARTEKMEVEFKGRNSWYQGDSSKDLAMTAFALQVSSALGSSNRSYEPEEYFKKIEDAVREQYPEQFAQPSHKPTQVSPASAPKAVGKTVWDAMLVEYPEAQDVFGDFVSDGTFKDNAADKEKYAKGVMA